MTTTNAPSSDMASLRTTSLNKENDLMVAFCPCLSSTILALMKHPIVADCYDIDGVG